MRTELCFHNYISNINTVEPQLGVISELTGFANGSSRVYGMDFLLKKSWDTGINTWLGYTLGSTRYTFQDFSEASFNAPNDIRHNFNFVSSYTRDNFQMSVNTKYHSGLPFTSANLVFNEEDPDADHPFQYLLNYQSINEERLNPYLKIDVNVSYSFDFNPIDNSKIELSCSLQNILNRKNYVAREYFLDFNDSTSTYSAASIQKALLDRTALFLIRFHW